VFRTVRNLFTTLHMQELHRTPKVYPLQLKDDIEYETQRYYKIFRALLIKVYDNSYDRSRINRWG